jgi:hypothetical protein
VYDVRVRGGVVHESSACTGTGCQAVPGAPPPFRTPASATFSGLGNFPPAGAPASPKVLTCKKGFVRKRGKCVRRPPAKCKKGFVRKRGKCVRHRVATVRNRAASRPGRSK